MRGVSAEHVQQLPDRQRHRLHAVPSEHCSKNCLFKTYKTLH